jgi:hypothetical protein
MLPGFRFLLAAIVLSMSILVFGLGAAALLRAAHEEVASTPSWHTSSETIFAQQNEATRPVLAILRVESQPAEPKPSDNVPVAAAPAEPAATVAAPEPESIAALKPEDSAAPEMTKPEIPVPESPAQSEAAPAAADAPAAASETRIAATEQMLPPISEAAPVASEAMSARASPQADIASTKIATLGGPSVTIETQPPATAATAKPDRSVINKRLQARRAAQRRRIAARARLAQQAPQQPANPFAQPAPAVRSR